MATGASTPLSLCVLFTAHIQASLIGESVGGNSTSSLTNVVQLPSTRHSSVATSIVSRIQPRASTIQEQVSPLASEYTSLCTSPFNDPTIPLAVQQIYLWLLTNLRINGVIDVTDDWQTWAQLDIASFMATALTSVTVRTAPANLPEHGFAGIVVSQPHQPNTLIELKTENLNDKNIMSYCGELYLELVSLQAKQAKNVAYHGWNQYVVSITPGGYAQESQKMNGADEPYLQALRRYLPVFQHIEVPKVGSPADAGYVISWAKFHL